MSFGSILMTLLIGPLKLIFEIIYNISNVFIGHPGYSIILLSLAINILVLPLYRQADAMQEKARNIEAKLQPGIRHIKKTFSGDESMMILQTYYRQNNYSPLSALNGSISLLLEIPFFMAAYQFLSNLEILNGVSLGPILDLGKPDALINIAGFQVNVLPILMTAINVISSAIYLKGFPLKTKIQLYAMSAFFLVFLYTSPAGLVFYWTLNNLFSLVKTIFYKIKNPKKVLAVLMAVIGTVTIGFGIFFYDIESLKRRLFVIILGVLMLLPIVSPILISKLPKRKNAVAARPNKILFLMGGIFMTILTGLLIPSTFIAACPQEYVDITYFNQPLWYVVSSLCLATGTFMIWLQIFYKLANDKGKAIFDKAIWIVSCLAVVNYMFFGTNMGVLSSTLKYEKGMVFTNKEQFLNVVVIMAVVLVAYFVIKKASRIAISVLLVASIALSSMSALHLVAIKKDVSKISAEQTNDENQNINFTLSKNGKNVVVIMLDRALGMYVPYAYNEKPQLKTQFDGFVYYDNTISLGGYTNFASAAAYGGYEYTPIELNKRKNESLVDKQNEALTMMPRLFSENGFTSTVFDPVYANYSWLPDLTIYEKYSDIRRFNTRGRFDDISDKKAMVTNNLRNFFCFSIMKSMPLLLQQEIYDEGRYNQSVSVGENSNSSIQTLSSLSTATGANPLFNEVYNTLNALPYFTDIKEGNENTFCYLYNDITHRNTLLQTPDYIPVDKVDNTEYDAKNSNRFTVDGKTIKMETEEQITHYHSFMAAFLRLGEWFDYLRENGVYDNTRIIIVADHGFDLYHNENLVHEELKSHKDVSLYFPLLMVKDFNAKGISTSHEFMTNADVPTLATNGVIKNPVNPFTKNPINNNAKTEHKQFIILSDVSDTNKNNGNTFLPSTWASVSKNIWDKENWEFYQEKEVVMDDYTY